MKLARSSYCFKYLGESEGKIGILSKRCKIPTIKARDRKTFLMTEGFAKTINQIERKPIKKNEIKPTIKLPKKIVAVEKKPQKKAEKINKQISLNIENCLKRQLEKMSDPHSNQKAVTKEENN